MPRKMRRIAGIRKSLKAWKQAADALLTTQEGSDALQSDRVESLRELVAHSPEWRDRAKDFFRKQSLEAVRADMARLGIVATVEPKPDTPEPTPPKYPEPTQEKIAEIERIMYPDGVPDGFSPHPLNVQWYADRGNRHV